jgi:competence protein ComEA
VAERVRRQHGHADEVRGVLGLSVLLVIVGIALLLRSWWTPAVEPGLLIEVRGEVAVPGWHVVDPPTLAAAVEAAGGDASKVAETPLTEGALVVVDPDGARVTPSSNPLWVAEPLDLNLHGTEALAAIPNLSPAVAEAVTADRAVRGPFQEVAELRRVGGVGKSAVETITPFVRLAEVAPRRINLNTADAEQLARLPGVGPALAQRIVEDRAAHGEFGSVDALDRVKGIGPATVERLRDQATVER